MPTGKRVLTFIAATLMLPVSAALAQQNGTPSTMTPKNTGVASPGPQNPGGRMPESGQVPAPPAQGGPAGAKLTTGNGGK
jgi:hypothetical protein